MSAISKKLRSLNTPEKVQDFLNSIPFNHEKKEETYRSASEALKAGMAHCFEGALIAAAALEFQGQKPLLLDLRTTDKRDADHVVALFKKGRYWGAVSKTNHAVLRYREPVYRSVRELAMSYFHEYFLNDGKKTLRSYSKPYSLRRHGDRWLTSPEDLDDIVDALDRSPHFEILPRGHKLRRADEIEVRAGMIVEWKK